MGVIIDGPKHRLIQVSFFEPEKFEGNTIYVSLKDYYGMIGAEAFSAENFRYDGRIVQGFNQRIGSDPIEKVNNMTFRREIIADCNPPYSEFVEKLATENNGRVREDFLIDCLEFSRRLQKLDELKLATGLPR